MKPRHLGRLAMLTALAFGVGCYDGQPRRWPTDLPSPAPPSPPPDNSIHFERGGYPNSWEAVGLTRATLTDHTFGVYVHTRIAEWSGVPIIWKATGSGASIVPTDDTTTARGRSEATLTLGPEEGAGYSVTATAPTLPGAPELTFKATAVSQMVAVRDLADGGFVPANVTVISGHWVGWRYDSSEEDAHNVIFEDDPTRPVSSGDLWDLWAGSLYHTRLFAGSPRTIRYRCTYHSTDFVSGEVGTVTVK